MADLLKPLVAALVLTAALATEASAQAPNPTPELSATRLLRRIHLSLRGREPTLEAYRAVLDAPDDDARGALLRAAVDDALQSPEFENVLLRFAHDLLGNASYNYDTNNKIAWAINLKACPDDSLHAGRLGMLTRYNEREGDGTAICTDPTATVRSVAPWWAPQTEVEVVGRAGNDNLAAADGTDCGRVGLIFGGAVGRHVECGCGPNLRFCARPHPDQTNNVATSIRRSIFEEPAQLFRHVVSSGAPLSDLVVGDYTVVNQGLAFMYLRSGRQAGRNRGTDTDDAWFARHAEAPHSYQKVRFSELSDTYTSERTVRFDPRRESGGLAAMPSAGVLTTIGMLGSGSRERVRAARALETFACREFIPPAPDLHFDPFLRDPATEGACQHCHQLIDPAAIHFKRFAPNAKQIWGMEPWLWGRHDDFGRNLAVAFDTETVMTPVSPVEVENNPNARFMDFLPEDQPLLGQTSDGTIGPLGFGKILVASGEFDRCMVRRFYGEFGGRMLTPGTDDALIESLLTTYLDAERSGLALIRAIVAHEEFRLGR